VPEHKSGLDIIGERERARPDAIGYHFLRDYAEGEVSREIPIERRLPARLEPKRVLRVLPVKFARVGMLGDEPDDFRAARLRTTRCAVKLWMHRMRLQFRSLPRTGKLVIFRRPSVFPHSPDVNSSGDDSSGATECAKLLGLKPLHIVGRKPQKAPLPRIVTDFEGVSLQKSLHSGTLKTDNAPVQFFGASPNQVHSVPYLLNPNHVTGFCRLLGFEWFLWFTWARGVCFRSPRSIASKRKH